MQKDIQKHRKEKIDIFIEKHGNIDELNKYINSGKTVTQDGINNIINNHNVDQFKPLADQAKGFENVKKYIDEYNKAVNDGSKNQNLYVDALSKTNPKLQTYLKGLKGAEGSMFDYGVQLVSAELKTMGLTIVTTALNAAMTMGVSALISFIAVPIANFFDDLINGEENAKKAFEESKQATREAKSELDSLRDTNEKTAKSANELSSKYAELAQGYDFTNLENKWLSNDKYKEFLDLNNQLGELFPTLTKKYDENGNAIYDLGGDVDSITGKIKELVEQQNRLAKGDILKNLSTYVEGKDDKKGQLSIISKLNSDVRDRKKELDELDKRLEDVLNKKSGTYQVVMPKDLEDLYGSEYIKYFTPKSTGDGYVSDFSNIKKDDLEKIQYHFANIRATYESEFEATKTEFENANKELSSTMMLYVEDLDVYKNGGKFIQSAIENMISNINWSSFDLKNLDQVKNHIQENILSSFQQVEKDPEKKIKLIDIYNNFFSLDTESMSISEIENAFNDYVNQLYGVLGKKGESLKDFKIRMGLKLETYVDSEAENNKNALIKLLMNNGFTKEIAEQIIGNLTKDEISYAIKVKIDTVVDSKKDVDYNKDAISNLISGKQEDELKKAQLSFKKAWKELDNNLTDDSYKEAGKGFAKSEFNFGSKELTDLSKFKDEVVKLGEAGKLTSKNLENLDGCNEFLEATGLSATEAAKKMNALVDSSKQLAGMSTGIKAITSAYDEKKENRKKSNVVSSSTLNSLGDTLGVSEWEEKDKKVWEEYKKVAGDSSKGLKELKSAQDDLATSFVNNRNFLSNLNDENKDYYEGLLKEMGIENADVIIKNELALAKRGLTRSDISNMTLKEAEAMSSENGASKDLKTALYELMLEKLHNNETKINTASDCEQLLNLARNAGIATSQLQGLANASIILSKVERIDANNSGLQEVINKNADSNGKVSYTTKDGKLKEFSSVTAARSYLSQMSNLSKREREKAEKEIKDFEKKNTSKLKLNIPKLSTTPGNQSNGSGSKDKDSGSNGSSKDKTEIDWLERRLTRMQQIIDLTNAKLQNLFSVKDKNNNLAKQIKQNTTLMKQYSRAADIYEKKFKTASKSTTKGTGKKKKTIKGLTPDIIDKIKSGKYTKESYSKLVQRYGSDYADKINRYIGYWDKRQDALKNVEEQKAKIRQNKIDQYTNLQNEQDETIAKNNAEKENATLGNKYEYIKNIREATEKTYEYQIKIAEEEGKTLVADKLRAEQEKAILQTYQDEVDAIKEQYDYKRAMLESGEYDSNGNLKKRGFNYYNNQIDILESRGLMLDSSWYESKNALERQNIADKQDEKAKLAAQLPNFKEGTQAWQKLQSDIGECDNSIAESIKSINANSTSIRELKDKIDEKFYNNVSNLHNEFDFLSSLKYGETTDSDTGNFTDTGNLKMIAEYFKMTSSITGREKAEKDYDSFGKALENYKNGKATNDDLERLKGYFNDDGSLNLQEAENKLEDYRSKVQEQIRNEIAGEQAIIDLMKQKYEAQKSYLQDIINAKKEALDIEKDLYDYERNIADKTKNVANLQKQINAVRGDDSEEGMARLSKLQVSLDEANRDLQDTEYERYLSDQKNMLDELFSEYEDLVKNLEKDTQAILKDGLDYIKNKEGLGKLLNDAADDYGYVKSETLDDVVNAFEDGKPININNPQDQPLSELIQTKCNEIVSAIKKEPEPSNTSQEVKDSMKEYGYTEKQATEIASHNDAKTQQASKIGDMDAILMKPEKVISTAKSILTGMGTSNYWVKSEDKLKKTPESAFNKWIQKKGWHQVKKGKKTYNSYLTTAGLNALKDAFGLKDVSGSDVLARFFKQQGVSGFKTGGIGRLVKANGEDGLAMVRNGEGFVAPEHVEAIKGLLDITPDLNELVGDMIKIPSNLVKPSQSNIGDVSFEFNLPDVKDPQSFLTAIQNDKKVQKALQEVTLGRVNGNGKLSVNRIR